MPYILYYRLAWDAFKLSCASFYSHVLKIQPWVVDMPGNVWISTWIYNKVPFCLSGCTGWICKDWPAAGSERKNWKNKERKTLLYKQNICLCSPETYAIRIMLSDSLSHTQECKEAGGQETTRLWKHNTWTWSVSKGPRACLQRCFRNIKLLIVTFPLFFFLCLGLIVSVCVCVCAWEWLIPQEIVWHLIWQGVAGGALTQHRRKSTSPMEWRGGAGDEIHRQLWWNESWDAKHTNANCALTSSFQKITPQEGIVLTRR